MAKYRSWTRDPETGKGRALLADGSGRLIELDEKPPESEFAPKPEGSPEGAFVKTPGGQFSEQLRQVKDGEYVGAGGRFREEYLGEVMDRRNEMERAAATRLGARMQAKGQIDSRNKRMDYTPAQRKQISTLRESRAKLEAEFSNGQHTPEQMLEFEEQLYLQEQSIMPQPTEAPPSAQEIFEQSLTKHPVTGQLGRVLNSGKWEPLSNGYSPAERVKLAVLARESIEAEVLSYDKEGKPNKYAVATADKVNEWINTFQTAGIQTNAITSGVPEATGRPQLRERPVAPQGQQDVQSLALTDKDIEIGKKFGKTKEDMIRDIQKAAETGTFEPTQKSQYYKTWDELSPEQQEKVLKKYRREEAAKGRPVPAFGMPPGRHKPQTEEQFIESVKSDPDLLQTYLEGWTGAISPEYRKEGSPPKSWNDAAADEKRVMYDNYKKTVKSGARIKSFEDFTYLMTRHPEKITEFLK